MDGQTYMTELVVAFRNFANVTYKPMQTTCLASSNELIFKPSKKNYLFTYCDVLSDSDICLNYDKRKCLWNFWIGMAPEKNHEGLTLVRSCKFPKKYNEYLFL
jgi:hypothetical protein